MNIFQILVTSPDVPTINGVKISVQGVAQVKIGSDDQFLRYHRTVRLVPNDIQGSYCLFREAAQNFLGKDVSEIQAIAHHTLEGHQRSIMGKMTVEEILQNKQKFGEEVFEIATVGTDGSFLNRSIELR